MQGERRRESTHYNGVSEERDKGSNRYSYLE
jgi:hypothetical protein